MDDPANEWQAITGQELKQMQAQPQEEGKWDRLLDRLALGQILRRAVRTSGCAI
jgi:hypothetical protein